MSTRIHDDTDYIRPEITRQDKISMNIDVMYKKLKNYIPIPKSNHIDVPVGVWIKYVSQEGKYRSGGVLIKNAAPEYYVLKCGRLTWSVNLSKNKIFMQDFKKKKIEQIEKDKLYNLFKNGLIEFKIPDEHKNEN